MNSVFRGAVGLRRLNKCLLRKKTLINLCPCVYSSSKGDEPKKKYSKALYTLATLSGIVAGYKLFSYSNNDDENEEEVEEVKKPSEKSTESKEEDFRTWHKTHRLDLPTYKLEQIREHDTLDKGFWVTYGIGVYDVTEFVPKHPGSGNINLGAGTAIDPFWHVFQQHNTKEILTLLEPYRIGNLPKESEGSTDDLGSPWEHEPKRHPLLIRAAERPFNAETPLALLAEKFLTPNEVFYVRNHLPVPLIDVDSYELEVDIEGTDVRKSFTLDDIKKLPQHTVTATIMCGGNRRSEMTKVKPVKGLSWGGGAVGNAEWTGIRLRDILLAMGVQSDEKRHVVFEGSDLDPTAHPYGASIPLAKAMDERGDVILAYAMNGETINRDHGFPLRVVVPGTVGARNVKWLSKIIVSEHESNSHWQQNDYKGFSPSTDWDTVDFTKSPAIQAMPVTSAICTPSSGESVKVENGFINVKGYAWSGGGRRIVRVDLTVDGGESWHVAELEQEDKPDGRHYGWSLWSAKIPVGENKTEVEIWSKAVDSAYNCQPEEFKNTWNLRGVLSNAYHRVKVNLK